MYTVVPHISLFAVGAAGGERGHQMEREREEAKTEMLHEVLCPG